MSWHPTCADVMGGHQEGLHLAGANRQNSEASGNHRKERLGGAEESHSSRLLRGGLLEDQSTEIHDPDGAVYD